MSILDLFGMHGNLSPEEDMLQPCMNEHLRAVRITILPDTSKSDASFKAKYLHAAVYVVETSTSFEFAAPASLSFFTLLFYVFLSHLNLEDL